MVFKDSEEIVELVHATDDEAELLTAPVGAPLVSIHRTTLDEDGDPIEFSHDLFRSDWDRMTMMTPAAG